MLKWLAWVAFVALLTAVVYLTWNLLKAVKAERLTDAIVRKGDELKAHHDEKVHERQLKLAGLSA